MIKIIKSDCVYIVRIKSKFNFMYDEKEVEVDGLNEVDEYEEETEEEEEDDEVVKKDEDEDDSDDM